MFTCRGAALLLLLLIATGVRAQCQCIDVGDIKRRIIEAQTAIQAYNAEMVKMIEQIQRTKQPLPYTAERREKLQARVQQALNQANPGAISTAPVAGHNAGGTDNLCNISVNLHPAATACMRESVRRHEEHHRQECLKTRSAGSVAGAVLSGKTDRFERDGASLMQYATEEIGGYTTELMFLQTELARLQSAPECQPKKPPVEVIDYTAQPRQRKPKP